ncbi:MAG: hypothetical protein A4S14_13205 [Proteobacteria bacterium SG_bin9]|nr:MAG: hypothetical protein A4S14_13205 [Proteobacteria bacterium SG_bin9]
MSITEPISAADRLRVWVRGLIATLRGQSVSYPLGYMASLDGARGLMTIGVLVAHTRMALFEGAMVYMDVFFAMSGYLITSILLKDYQKRGHIRLKNFYLRRIMRLFPALTAMVICFIALSWFFSDNFRERLIEGLVTWFYLMDYWSLISPLIGIHAETVYTGHTWSLAVEEQFYLIWPLLLICLLRFSGVTVRTAMIIVGLALAFWLWRIYLTVNGAPIAHLYRAFDTRADALLSGCALAVLLKAVDISAYPRLWKACAMALVPIAALSLIACFTMNHHMRWYYCVSPLFGAIPGVISVVGLLHPERTFMHKLYEHPVPVFIGRICYGLYIWHFPIFAWIATWRPLYITTFLVGWPLTFAVATLSYYLIERPAMHARPGV